MHIPARKVHTSSTLSFWSTEHDASGDTHGQPTCQWPMAAESAFQNSGIFGNGAGLSQELQNPAQSQLPSSSQSFTMLPMGVSRKQPKINNRNAAAQL
eukprot:498476-Pelagomonas_calceolata.AAC.5